MQYTRQEAFKPNSREAEVRKTVSTIIFMNQYFLNCSHNGIQTFSALGLGLLLPWPKKEKRRSAEPVKCNENYKRLFGTDLDYSFTIDHVLLIKFDSLQIVSDKFF